MVDNLPRRPSFAIVREDHEHPYGRVALDARASRLARRDRLSASGLLVEIHTDEGIVGVGEAPGPALPTIRTNFEAKQTQFLVGQDPLRTEWLVHRMEEFTDWREDQNRRRHGEVQPERPDLPDLVPEWRNQRIWRDVCNGRITLDPDKRLPLYKDAQRRLLNDVRVLRRLQHGSPQHGVPQLVTEASLASRGGVRGWHPSRPGAL